MASNASNICAKGFFLVNFFFYLWENTNFLELCECLHLSCDITVAQFKHLLLYINVLCLHYCMLCKISSEKYVVTFLLMPHMQSSFKTSNLCAMKMQMCAACPNLKVPSSFYYGYMYVIPVISSIARFSTSYL